MKSLSSLKSYISELSTLNTKSLAIFNLGLMGVIIWDVLNRLLLVGNVYGPTGMMPLDPSNEVCKKQLAQFCFIKFSLFSIFNSDMGQTILFSSMIICALTILFGYRKFWLFWILVFLYASIKMRYFLTLNGGDFQIAWILIWASFFPWEKIHLRGYATSVNHWSFFIFLVNAVAFYCYAGFAKLGGQWLDGRGVYSALHFDFMLNPGFESIRNLSLFMSFLNYLTLFLETSLVFALFISPLRFPKVRIILLSVFCCFHIGMGLALHTFPLPQLGVLTWVAFFPTPRNEKFDFAKYAVRDKFKYLFSICLTVLCLVSGAGTLDQSYLLGRLRVVEGTFNLTSGLGIGTNWRFFAPYGIYNTGWFVILGHKKNNELVQIDATERASNSQLNFDKPALRTSIYKNRIYSRIFFNLTPSSPVKIPVDMFTSYVCRNYAEIKDVEIILFDQEITPLGLTSPKRYSLGKETCIR